MAEGLTDEVQEQGSQATESLNGGGSAFSKLLSKDVLIPLAATAATAAAAGYAAKKAPDVKNKIAGEAKQGAQQLGKEGAEGAKQSILGGGSPLGALASGASKLIPGMGKGGGKNKKTRRLPIQRWTDVAVPVEEAYEQWTNFEEFPKFMHRVLSVRQEDDNKLQWQEKIWFSRRQWEGEITDQRENDRVAWKTVSGTSHSGIVSFHKLDDRLTRVLVTVDFQPTGMIEKMGSGLRFVKRAVQADLARFKAYVELGEAEGLEYEVAPEQSKQDDAEGDAQEATSRQEDSDESDSDSEPKSKSDSNGSSDEEREEREKRRQERREALKSSR
jgi:uncharacterized membrane protein